MLIDRRRKARPPSRVLRGIDIAVAATALLIVAPLWAAICLAIRLTGPGPALFRQVRVGVGEEPFMLYKFRTMRPGGDDRALRELVAAELRGEDTYCNGSCKLDDDPRITPVGRWLRSTSLDELPQLLNVLRGEMALVGPRPCLQWEAELFPAQYAERFTVRPGLTGLWQVRGRSTVGTLEMLRLDVEYVRTRDVLGDLRLLLATGPALLRRDGAR